MEIVQERIGEGLKILQAADGKERRLEELRLQRERHQSRRSVSKEGAGAGESVDSGTNEWKEMLYRWAGSNEELNIPSNTLKECPDSQNIMAIIQICRSSDSGGRYLDEKKR